MDVIESYDGTIEPGLENINEQFDKSRLEETCVLVDRDNCLVTHRKDKPRSYKVNLSHSATPTRPLSLSQSSLSLTKYFLIEKDSESFLFEEVSKEAGV